MSFLFAPAAGAAHSRRPQTANPPAEVQRKTPRPSGANPPAAVRVPRSADAEKEPPVRGEPACGSSRAPLSRCRKGAARQGRTRLRQFACPTQPVQKRSCPSGANPPAAVRVPRSADAEKELPVRGEPACGSSRAPLSRCRKGAARQGRTRLRQFACPAQPMQKRSRPLGRTRLRQFVCPAQPAQKRSRPLGRTRLRQFVCPGHLVPRKEKHRRITSTVLKVCTFTQIAAAYRHPYAPAPAGPVPDDRAR